LIRSVVGGSLWPRDAANVQQHPHSVVVAVGGPPTSPLSLRGAEGRPSVGPLDAPGVVVVQDYFTPAENGVAGFRGCPPCVLKLSLRLVRVVPGWLQWRCLQVDVLLGLIFGMGAG